MRQIVFDEQPIYCIADMHGAFDNVLKGVLDSSIEKCILVILGDIGLGFRDKSLTQSIFRRFNKMLKERDIKVIMLRGNHDNKEWFDDEVINFENIFTVHDYTILSVGDKNALCIGGAISIDRLYRIGHWEQSVKSFTKIGMKREDAEIYCPKSYWKNEIPYYDETFFAELKTSGIKIDYVFTHTSPSFAFKSDKSGIRMWLKDDKELEEDLIKEREVFDLIYQELKANEHPLNVWAYGHFHENNVEYIENTKFVAIINADYCLHIYSMHNV